MKRGSKSDVESTRYDAVDEGGGIVRLATLLPVPALLRDFGVDPGELLASVGLEPTAFDDAEKLMPFRSAGTLLARCARATGCPHFGLLVGQRADVETLGRLGSLMRESPTVDAALRSLIMHMHLQARGGVPTRTVVGDRAILGYAIYQRDMPGTAQVHDLVVAMSCNVMRSLAGLGWRPLAATFSHAAPEDVAPYRRWFRTPLHFDADTTALVFERSWLDRALPGSDTALHALLQRTIAAESAQLGDLVELVRSTLRTMIPIGRASEASIANLLGIPSRTLRRQLIARGTNFRTLTTEARYEIARQLLTDTRMAIVEVAAALEYADASAFTRAFRRWTEMSPAAWRARVSTDARA